MKHTNDILKHPALITHLTGASNYTWFHFSNGSKVMLSKPLSAFELSLPSFIRIHKTALINPDYIQQVQPPLRTKAPGGVVMPGNVVLPISRRRWLDVAETLQQHAASSIVDQSTADTYVVQSEKESIKNRIDKSEESVNQRMSLPARQVYAFIRDEMKGVLIRQVLAAKWPHCTVLFFASGASLIDHIARTPTRDLPALVFLDVRTVGWAGLSALEHIKTDRRLCLIPTVLFIDNQSGNDIEVCYAAGANSVIPQPAGYTEFKETVERICTYWLSFAALPTAEVAGI